MVRDSPNPHPHPKPKPKPKPNPKQAECEVLRRKLEAEEKEKAKMSDELRRAKAESRALLTGECPRHPIQPSTPSTSLHLPHCISLLHYLTAGQCGETGPAPTSTPIACPHPTACPHPHPTPHLHPPPPGMNVANATKDFTGKLRMKAMERTMRSDGAAALETMVGLNQSERIEAVTALCSWLGVGVANLTLTLTLTLNLTR